MAGTLLSACSDDEQGDSSGATGPGGGRCPIPAAVEYDDQGCLTFDGASALCGSASDNSICDTSVGCGTSTEESCMINCEYGTNENCYTQADVQCLVDAASCRTDCDALAACGFLI